MEGKEVVVRDSFEPFVIMDRLDDELIVQELQGKLPQVLTYHFTQDGKETWGLSKSGVDEATNQLAKGGEVIRELEMNFEDNDEEGFFQVKSGRFVVSKDGKEILLDTKFGTKRQPKKTTNTKTGEIKYNPFWYEQGAMKAARNASMRLIPVEIKEAVIAFAKTAGKVKRVEPEEPSESDKLCSKLHDEMVRFKTGEELATFWTDNLKAGSENRKTLNPKHFDLLCKLKDELKKKLEGK